jgi:DNA-binding PadR family transcriptional regulator
MDDQSHDSERLEMPQSVPRGLLRHIIPRLLKKNDLSGTDIMQMLSDYTDGQWNPSPGTIYPLLSSFEEDGTIETVRVEGRTKIYRLTDKGRKEISAFMKHQRGRVGHKTRLGPMIWENVLEPEERVRFHLLGLRHIVEMLEGVVALVGKRERKHMKQELEETQAKLFSIIDELESGGT